MGQTAQALGPRSRPRSRADRSGTTLEHGLRPRCVARWAGLSRADRGRSVESRDSVGVEVQCGLSGLGDVQGFESWVPPGRFPRSTTVDHGMELTSRAVEASPYYRGIALHFTRPGEPHGQLPHRVAHRATAGGVFVRPSGPVDRARARRDRDLASRLQRAASTYRVGWPDTHGVCPSSSGSTPRMTRCDSASDPCLFVGDANKRPASRGPRGHDVGASAAAHFERQVQAQKADTGCHRALDVVYRDPNGARCRLASSRIGMARAVSLGPIFRARHRGNASR